MNLKHTWLTRLFKPRLADDSNTHVSITAGLILTPTADTQSLTYDLLIPESITRRQLIRDVEFSHTPEYQYSIQGATFARFEFKKPREPIEVSMRITAELYDADFHSLRTRSLLHQQKLEVPAVPDLDQWLICEKFIETDASEIQKAAKPLLGKDIEETLRNTMEFVVTSIRQYQYHSGDKGALWALQSGTGDCTEFSDLFVALARANNIPARVCEGYSLPPSIGHTPKHNWAEVYMKEHGWVSFDPAHVKSGSASFERLRAKYLYVNCRRNILVNNFRCHFGVFTWQGSSVSCNDSFILHHFQPLR